MFRPLSACQDLRGSDRAWPGGAGIVGNKGARRAGARSGRGGRPPTFETSRNSRMPFGEEESKVSRCVLFSTNSAMNLSRAVVTSGVSATNWQKKNRICRNAGGHAASGQIQSLLLGTQRDGQIEPCCRARSLAGRSSRAHAAGAMHAHTQQRPSRRDATPDWQVQTAQAVGV